MTAGRVLASLTAAAAVAGCVAVVVSMSENPSTNQAADTYRPPVSTAARTYPVPVTPTGTGSPAAASEAAPSVAATSSAATTSTAPRSVATTSVAASPALSSAAHRAAKTVAPASASPAAKARAATPVRGVALPLKYRTHNATRVLTVTATTRGRTTARLQAWYKAPGGGWLKYGTSMTAHIGSQGMTPTPSESASKTPMGSFTLTRAFGHNADPGTALPYFRTRPSDWWISQPGPLYNTHQRCTSHCRFTQGAPNEHLYYETPYYNYAVVIDYNTRNAPGGVRQGAGSAFFLHVTDGYPTAGCVAIPQKRLVRLMRWLRPTTHPRILIGVHR
jgi:L,D-peptidoglycan transpeptidase YkuD (ErfK/YbiS/YcfS/YnhG family)